MILTPFMSLAFAAIEALELESVWLIIGFFAFVAVSAAVAIIIILRQNRYGVPTNFMHSAMIVLLVITLLLSLVFAVGLYRMSSDMRSQDSPPPVENSSLTTERSLSRAILSVEPACSRQVLSFKYGFYQFI